jgi:hypothetical protein
VGVKAFNTLGLTDEFSPLPNSPRQGEGANSALKTVCCIRVLDSLDRQVGTPPQDEYWQMSCVRSEQVKCVFRPFVLVTLIWANV